MNRHVSLERRRRPGGPNPILGMALAALVGAVAWSLLLGALLLVTG
jgi:hypothetical protein